MSTSPPAAEPEPRARRQALRSFHRPLTERTKASAQGSPAYLVAGFLHLFLLLILSFWTVAVYVRERVRRVEAKIATTNEVVVKEQREQTEAIKAAGEEALQEEAPQLDVDSAYQEASGATKGSLSDDAAAVFGAGSQSGFGRGGSKNSKGGPSSASEGSIRLSLDWLIKHQAADGGWADLPKTHLQTGRLPTHGDIARTGLGLLCFMSANVGPSKVSSFQPKLRRARAWLISRVEKDGNFKHRQGEGTRPRPAYPTKNYNQAVGTLALSELLLRDPDVPGLRGALQRSVGWIEKHMNKEGWRYRGQNHADTSVVGWMILALKSAQQNKVEVKPFVYTRVRAYMEKVSNTDGTTDYLTRGGSTPAMTATGLFLRAVLGEPVTSPRNRAAAALTEKQGILRTQSKTKACQNLYQLYYAALGLYQCGGPLWERFNPRVRDALVKAQIRGDKSDVIEGQVRPECERGSWRPGGYCWDDQLLATCFATLILETYYRYLRPGSEGARFGDPLLDPEAGVTPGQKLLRAALATFHAAKKTKAPAEVLAAEAALTRAAKKLADEAPPRSQELVHYARVRLVELAGLAGDSDGVIARSTRYLQGLPSDQTPKPAVLRLRALAQVKQLGARVTPLIKQGTEPARRAALKEVRALDAELETQRLRLIKAAPTAAAELLKLQELVAALEAGLNMVLDPEGEVARRAQALLRTPATQAPSVKEQRLLRALLVQAIHAFLEAAKQKNPGGLVQGEANLRIVRARRVEARGLDPKALQPLRRLEERARALHVHALAAHERAAELRDVAERFLKRFPNSSLRPGVERQLLAVLAARIQAGKGTPKIVQRVVQLAEHTNGESRQPLAIGELLSACGAHEQAIPFFRKALERTPKGEPLLRARLGLVRAARLADDLALAEQQLTGFVGKDRDRFGVVMERAALLRCRGKYPAALKEYFAVLRALKAKRPPAWWDAAEQVANTYLEQGDVPKARAYLTELVATDKSLGTAAHKARLLPLINEVDVWRPGRNKPTATIRWGAR